MKYILRAKRGSQKRDQGPSFYDIATWTLWASVSSRDGLANLRLIDPKTLQEASGVECWDVSLSLALRVPGPK